MVSADVLGPTDVFEVRVFPEDKLTGTYRVGSDGSIVYPLLGVVEVAGKTANQLALELQERLSTEFVKDAHVTVFVQEHNSAKVSIIGQVQKPGRYPYRTDLSLIEAVAEAGGPTDRAATAIVVVTRHYGGEEASYEVPFKDITLGRESDFPLLPGDVVVVPESAIR